MKSDFFSLYIHIPFCISKCKYCDFFSVEANVIPDSYITCLINEIVFYSKKYNVSCWKTVYIGGGTPSLLTENQLKKIFSVISVDNESEITMEVNPDDVTQKFLEVLSLTPVNRISCGIQSLNDESLKFVKRRANRHQNLEAIYLINNFWKGKKSFDLICGLPYETKDSFFEAVNLITESHTEHISMYSLCVEDETPLGKLINQNKIPYDFDFTDELWLFSKKLLENKGFRQYEISNFAKEGFESKHNLTYWNHNNYIGCGSGATGTVYKENGEGSRWTNTTDIHKYLEFWQDKDNQSICNFDIPLLEENIDVETSKFEFFMMGLRKNSGISDKQYYEIFKDELPISFIQKIEEWKKNDLAGICENNHEKKYFLTKSGLLFLNKFLSELDL